MKKLLLFCLLSPWLSGCVSTSSGNGQLLLVETRIDLNECVITIVRDPKTQQTYMVNSRGGICKLDQ